MFYYFLWDGFLLFMAFLKVLQNLFVSDYLKIIDSSICYGSFELIYYRCTAMP